MPRRLNVLEVIPTLDRSGAEKQLALLATGLDPERFAVHVCALTRGGPYADPLRQAGIPLEVLGKALKLDPLLPRRLANLMRRWEIDLVHTWLFAGNSYGRWAARKARVPVVIAGERCWDSWKARWQLAIDRRLARRTDVVLGNSTGVVEFYRRQGIDPAKLRVIPNGIEAAHVPAVDGQAIRASMGVPAEAPLFAVVGRLWQQKRVERAIVAACLLRVAEVDCHLAVVGDGPQRRELERLAETQAQTDAIHFLGHRDDVPTLLQACDGVVLASDFEGMPNVVMEAMAAARPAVVTDIPGLRDLVVEGETGFLVPPGEGPRALARAMLRLCEDPALRKRMGRAGRERLRTHFTVERMVRAHEDLYLELARRKGLDV